MAVLLEVKSLSYRGAPLDGCGITLLFRVLKMLHDTSSLFSFVGHLNANGFRFTIGLPCGELARAYLDHHCGRLCVLFRRASLESEMATTRVFGSSECVVDIH